MRPSALLNGRYMQVTVRFALIHADAVSMHGQDPLVVPGGKVIQLLFNLVVAGLAIDTPEAAASLGIICRFFCRPDVVHRQMLATCLLCHTPASKFHVKPSDLGEDELRRRTITDMRAPRLKGQRGAKAPSGLVTTDMYPAVTNDR